MSALFFIIPQFLENNCSNSYPQLAVYSVHRIGTADSGSFQ